MKTEAPTSDSDPINSIRSKIRSARQSLSDFERQLFDEKIHTQIKTWLVSQNPGSTAIFLPFDGEPDLLPIVTWLRKRGIQLALPVVNFDQPGHMQFHLWDETTELTTNRYGIKEPINTKQIKHPDIILAPLVAFSSSGTRLGMGGGYYDRWLAAADPCPRFAGIAYELQRIEKLPRRDWDVPLDMIFTEKGRFSFIKKGQ